MAAPENFLLHICPHCSGRIEFPSHGVGDEIDCPHCGRRTVLREHKQTKPETQQPNQQAIGGRRSMLPIAAIGGVVVLAVFVIGALFLAAKEKQKARQDVKTELIAFKVGLRDGLTLADIRSQRKKLNVVFELNKTQLPSNFSLTGLNLYLEASDYFWGKQSGYTRSVIYKLDAMWMEVVLKSDDPSDKVYLTSTKIAQSSDIGRFESEWSPKLFVRKSLTRCGEEVEKLLAQLE